MKRLCAILLGLMMLAGLCACGRRTSPAPAPKTPEPVTVITPAQPTPSEAVPVSTPDGTTPLTAAELDWFGRCFFNVVPGWGPNRFLACSYDRPEDMDLAAVLALAAVFLVFSTLLNLFLGLKMPNLHWTSEITPIKQSGAVAIVLLGGWAYAAAMAVLYFLVGRHMGFAAYMVAFLALTLAAAVLLYIWVRKKGCAIFASL